MLPYHARHRQSTRPAVTRPSPRPAEPLTRRETRKHEVFEDIEEKDGHRWWLWVFVTDATTVFVMDTSRSAGDAGGEWASTWSRPRWRRARGWSSPRIPIRRISRWPASTALTRCGAGRDIWWAFSGGLGPLSPRRSATGAMRGPSGSRCWTGPITPWRPPCRAPMATLSAAARRQRAFTDIVDAHRILQASDAAKGLLHPAAAKVIAHAQQRVGLAGLACNQDVPYGRAG